MLGALGVHDGPTLVTLVRLHWALASLVLVWAGWRGGALVARGLAPPSPSTTQRSPEAAPAGWEGGLAGAALCALFPLLVRFSTHTLSELASTLCLVAALVVIGELREGEARDHRAKAVAAGLLLGAGIGLRIQYAPVAVIAGLWLLSGRRAWQCGRVAFTAALALLVFGVVDRLTWNDYFASYVAYVKFNLVDGGAAGFGTRPASWYLDQFVHRLPYGLILIGGASLAAFRASWPFVMSAVAVAVLHSLEPHKEERFVMVCWPLLLVAAGGALGGLLARARAWRPTNRGGSNRARRVSGALVLVAVAGVLLDGGLHCRGNDFVLPRARFAAQAWVGRQPDATGLLYDEPLFVGGNVWLGRRLPQLAFRPALLGDTLFSHVLVLRGSDAERAAKGAGFRVVFHVEDVVVLRRDNRDD